MNSGQANNVYYYILSSMRVIMTFVEFTFFFLFTFKVDLLRIHPLWIWYLSILQWPYVKHVMKRMGRSKFVQLGSIISWWYYNVHVSVQAHKGMNKKYQWTPIYYSCFCFIIPIYLNGHLKPLAAKLGFTQAHK